MPYETVRLHALHWPWSRPPKEPLPRRPWCGTFDGTTTTWFGPFKTFMWPLPSRCLLLSQQQIKPTRHEWKVRRIRRPRSWRPNYH